MRLSEFHQIMRERGQVPSAKQGGNKGIRRRWSEDRRDYLDQMRERSARKLLSEIFTETRV